MSPGTAPSPPSAPVRHERVRADATDRLEASLVGAGPHVEAVLDVGTTAGGDLLLVLPEPAARLADLVTERGWPTAGEAVTVLVPLAQALERLHAAGVALTAADASSVVLDDAGAATWVVPETPVLLRRAGAAAFSAAVDEDLARFRGFAEALVQKAGGRLRLESGAHVSPMVDALFAVADPVPVRLSVPAEPLAPLPGRLLGAVHAPPAQEEVTGGSRVEGVLLARLRAAAEPLRAVRPRVWGVAGLAVAALLAALVLLPGPRADADRSSAVLPSSVADAAEYPGASRAPATSAVPAPSTSPGPVAPKGLSGEQAVVRLLAARAACLSTGASACLPAVDAAGSPAEAADSAALVAGTDPVLPRSAAAQVLSSGGGTVLARVDGAVVAAVRQSDGWRLRDVVAEPPR